MVRKADETIPQEKREITLNTSGSSATLIIHVEREKTGAQNGAFMVVEPPTRADGMSSGEIQR